MNEITLVNRCLVYQSVVLSNNCKDNHFYSYLNLIIFKT